MTRRIYMTNLYRHCPRIGCVCAKTNKIQRIICAFAAVLRNCTVLLYHAIYEVFVTYLCTFTKAEIFFCWFAGDSWPLDHRSWTHGDCLEPSKWLMSSKVLMSPKCAPKTERPSQATSPLLLHAKSCIGKRLQISFWINDKSSFRRAVAENMLTPLAFWNRLVIKPRKY